RRAWVEAGAIESTAARALEAILERGNAWGAAPAARADWALGLEVRQLEPGEATDVLYWVGCAGAYDPKGQSGAQAAARPLRAAANLRRARAASRPVLSRPPQRGGRGAPAAPRRHAGTRPRGDGAERAPDVLLRGRGRGELGRGARGSADRVPPDGRGSRD